MSTVPLVSVIIPFFNNALFIQESIESVLNQSYANWELLLCDDGSTDGSTEIAYGYVKRFPRKVRYFEHTGHRNHGLAATRNLGIQHANGQYIALLDADDVWVPEKLDQQVEILELVPEAGMVFGASKFWYSWEPNPPKSDYYSNYGLKPDTLVKPFELLKLVLQRKQTSPSMSNVMLRKDLLEIVGVFEENLHETFEDLVFLSKIYIHSPIYLSSHCWDLYRQHTGSIMAKIKKKSNQKRSKDFSYLIWLEKYLAANNIQDPDVLIAINFAKNRLDNRNFHNKIQTLRNMARKVKNMIISAMIYLLPNEMLSFIMLKYKGSNYYPRIGSINFGDLKRLRPINESGPRKYIRHTLENYYIEKFLASNSNIIKGRVLETSNNRYAVKYGSSQVTMLDTLSFGEAITFFCFTNVKACQTNIKSKESDIQSDTFDCIIFTHASEYIYDMRLAIEKLYKILKPGCTLLATFNGISHTTDAPRDKYRCCNFTSAYIEKVFNEFFPSQNIELQGYGNILVAIGLLHGVSSSELQPHELEYHDNNYEIIITVKAVKP